MSCMVCGHVKEKAVWHAEGGYVCKDCKSWCDQRAETELQAKRYQKIVMCALSVLYHREEKSGEAIMSQRFADLISALNANAAYNLMHHIKVSGWDAVFNSDKD